MPISNQVLSKYSYNKVLVETGSYMGDSINSALTGGYNTIHSIELSDKYFDICTNRFKENSNVTIHKGDSSKILLDVIKNIDEPITFWLDGHHSCGDTALGDYWCPLMVELDLIKKHHINTHTILIDDMRCWNVDNDVIGFGDKEIKDKLLSINPNYKFSYEDGEQPNDILVAKV